MTLSARETRRNAHAADALSRLVDWLLGLNGQRAERERRKALMELARMEDWQLDDLGLTRQWLERQLTAAGLGEGRQLMQSGARSQRNG